MWGSGGTQRWEVPPKHYAKASPGGLFTLRFTKGKALGWVILCIFQRSLVVSTWVQGEKDEKMLIPTKGRSGRSELEERKLKIFRRFPLGRKAWTWKGSKRNQNAVPVSCKSLLSWGDLLRHHTVPVTCCQPLRRSPYHSGPLFCYLKNEAVGLQEESVCVQSGERSSAGRNKLENLSSGWFLRCFRVLLYFFSSLSFPENSVDSYLGLNWRFRRPLHGGSGNKLPASPLRLLPVTKWLWGLCPKAICHFHSLMGYSGWF